MQNDVSLPRDENPQSTTPIEIGGRDGLLRFVDVLELGRSQTSTKVKCKACGKDFTGLTERMAAHFTGTPNHNVAACPKPEAGAKALGKKMLDDMESNRQTNPKRQGTPNKRKKETNAENGKGKKKQGYNVGRMLAGATPEAADTAHARFVLATGQSSDVGNNPFFLDVIMQARLNPLWCPKGRSAVSTTDPRG